MGKILRQILIGCFFLCASIAAGDAMLFAEPIEDETFSEEETGWQSVESRYFTVFYRPSVNLKKMEKKLKRRRFDVVSGGGYEYLSTNAEKVAYRLDRIFERVKEILDMYPQNMNVKIKIFKDRRELIDAYEKVFGEREDIVSFYIYRHETIYTDAVDISDSVIAHEMAHAIVDHYFLIRPPETVKEMLSCYVDEHLDD